MNRLREIRGHWAQPTHAEQSLHLLDLQPAKQHALELSCTAELGQRGGQRMDAVDVNVAVGRQHEQPRSLNSATEVNQEVQRGAIGVVQILQHEQYWLGICGTAQKIACRLLQAPQVILRVTWRSLFHRHPLGNRGDNAGDVADARTELGGARFNFTIQHVTVQCLYEWQIRQG